MLVDVHAPYPMRVIGDVVPDTLLQEVRRARNRPVLRDRLRALVLRIASTLFSHRSPFHRYRVRVDGMRSSGVGVAISVLTSPFEEAALGRPFGSAPESRYPQSLLSDMKAVEDEIATHPRDELRLVRNRSELDEALDAGATALVCPPRHGRQSRAPRHRAHAPGRPRRDVQANGRSSASTRRTPS